MSSDMRDDIHGLVEHIHASPKLAVIAVAGAGGQALSWILGVPGASKTVLEAIVPYGRLSMIEFLGHEPEQYVSPDTAREMARSAYRKALDLREAQEPVLGLACTATIATDRPKRGEHRCCIAAWDDDGVVTYSLVLDKGRRDRPGEEDVVSRIVLCALAQANGIEPDLSPGLLETERLEIEAAGHPNPLQLLLDGGPENGDIEKIPEKVRTVTVYPDGQMAADVPIKAAILPGSFNPLHSGHEQMAQVASEMLGGAQVVLEISVANVDKPPLEEAEVLRRLGQFRDKGQVVLTRAPTFREKAALLPGCTFVIGWDTAVRLVHPRYYGGQEEAMLAALEEIRAMGCRFLVAGRTDGGVFHTLADVDIPNGLADLFQEIPESRFRADVSSTELRANGG